MLLRYVDRTWILLERLIDKGNKEGEIKHIEIPEKEFHMLQREYQDLSVDVRKGYTKHIRLEKEGAIQLYPSLAMDFDFVDKWRNEGYALYYRDVLLVLPDPPLAEEEKAVGTTELNTDSKK